MENVTQVIETTQSQTNSTETKTSIGDLLNHVRGLWLNPGERISRGEYILVLLLFRTIIVIIGFIVYKTGSLDIYIKTSSFLTIVWGIALIRFMVPRLHDRNKSGRNSLWLIFFIIILIFSLFAMIFGGDLFYISEFINIPYITKYGISLFIFLISFIGIIVIIIKSLFFKGTSGDNQYGNDPLIRQNVNNSNYWILAIIGIILSIAINSGLPKIKNAMIDQYNNSIGLTGDLDYNTGDLNISPSQQ